MTKNKDRKDCNAICSLIIIFFIFPLILFLIIGIGGSYLTNGNEANFQYYHQQTNKEKEEYFQKLRELNK